GRDEGEGTLRVIWADEGNLQVIGEPLDHAVATAPGLLAEAEGNSPLGRSLCRLGGILRPRGLFLFILGVLAGRLCAGKWEQGVEGQQRHPHAQDKAPSCFSHVHPPSRAHRDAATRPEMYPGSPNPTLSPAVARYNSQCRWYP